MSVSYDDCVSALGTAIAANHGTGADLSGTGAVLRGRYPIPPRVPFAAISGPGLSGVRGRTLTGWAHSVTVDVEVWARATTSTTTDRTTQAEALMHAVIAAIQSAATTPGNALYGIPDLAYEAVEVSDLERPDGLLRIGMAWTWTLDRLVVGVST